MEPRFEGKVKKLYCDKSFKKQLTKALKVNSAEPENLHKMLENPYLKKYPPERIIEYVNTFSHNVQQKIDESYQEKFRLVDLMNVISEGRKPQELPTTIKFMSESRNFSGIKKKTGSSFRPLYDFLYQAMSGLPHTDGLDGKAMNILQETHEMLIEQVESDGTPEFLEELKLKICQSRDENNHDEVNLENIFNDRYSNPLNFPIEYLLNGMLPSKSVKENN